MHIDTFVCVFFKQNSYLIEVKELFSLQISVTALKEADLFIALDDSPVKSVVDTKHSHSAWLPL